MFRLSTIVLGVLAVAAPALAQDAAAWEGQVDGTDVYVRSGPTRNWYQITKLSRPAKVTVVGRQGDWVKIVPPKGVYSLISKLYVTADGTTGTVTSDNVQVRAGSILYPTMRSWVQTSLNRNDTVSIVGETEEYYKIAPPAGVVVYMSAQYVKAVGDVGEAATPRSQPATDSRPTSDATTAAAAEARAVARRFKAFKVAQAALIAEYQKPPNQRDPAKVLAMYKALDMPANDPLAPAVSYGIKYLQMDIERAKGAQEVRRLVEDALAEQQELQARRDRIKLDIGAASRPAARTTLQGRLAPSRLFPGSGVAPKRWVVRNQATGSILAFVQSTAGKVNLKEMEGWRVRLTGMRRYNASLRSTIVEVTEAHKLAGGEPISPPARRRPRRKLKGKPVGATTRPADKARPAPTTRPAAKGAATPRVKPAAADKSTQAMPATGLPMASTTQPSRLPMDPEEYK